MPEFVLNTPDTHRHLKKKPHPYYALSEFAKGYVEAAFFCNEGADSERDGEDKLNEMGVERLTRASVARIAEYCAEFERVAAPYLTLAYSIEPHMSASGAAIGGYEAEQAGRDLYFTSKGHGVGFWDREPLECDVWRLPDGTLTLDSSELPEDATLAACDPTLPKERSASRGGASLGRILTRLAQTSELYFEVYGGWINVR